MDDVARAREALDTLWWSQRLFADVLRANGWRVDERQVRRWFAGTNAFPPMLLAWLVRRADGMNSDPVPPQEGRASGYSAA